MPLPFQRLLDDDSDDGGPAAPPQQRMPQEGPPPQPARRAAQASRVTLAFRRGQKKAERLRNQLRSAVNVANPNVATAISRDVFGFSVLPRGKATFLNPGSTILVDKRRQSGRLKRRGVISYVTAVKRGLRKVMRGSKDAIHVSVTDEASMWVRNPNTAAALKGQRRADDIRGLRGRKRGKAFGRRYSPHPDLFSFELGCKGTRNPETVMSYVII